MMKKIIPMAVAAALISTQAIAGNFAGPGATSLSPAAGAPQSCAALANDVKIQLSNLVFAGYTCTDTSFTAALCHQTGTNKSQTIPCTYSEQHNNPDDPEEITGWLKSDDQCPDSNLDGTGQAATATFIGRVAFRGASGGGTVGAVNLRGNTCDGDTVEALTQ